MSTQPPAITPPSSGKTATLSSDATGGKGAESMTAAHAAETEPVDAEAVALQFLGEEPEGARTDATKKTKPPAAKKPGDQTPKKDATTAEAADGEHEEEEEEGGEQELEEESEETETTTEDEEEHENEDEAEQAAMSRLDNLVDALVKNPDSPGARKRLLKAMVENPKLKREVEDLKAKQGTTETLPPIVLPASSADPLAHVATVAQLEQEIQQADAWIAWCEENPDGGQYNPKDKDAVYDADQVKAQLRHSRAVLRGENGKRGHLTKVAANQEKLRVSHPQLFKKDSPELAALLKPAREGELSPSHPDYVMTLLDLQRGRKEREDEAKGIKKVVLNPKKAAAAAKTAGEAGGKQQQRPGAAGGGVNKAPALRPASAAEDLATLRKRSSEGDRNAGNKIAEMFLETAK